MIINNHTKTLRYYYTRPILHCVGQAIVQTSAVWIAMAFVAICVARHQCVHNICVRHCSRGFVEDCHIRQHGYV